MTDPEGFEQVLGYSAIEDALRLHAPEWRAERYPAHGGGLVT